VKSNSSRIIVDRIKMSKYEEDDINKMFSEIMSSNSIEGLNDSKDQEVIDIKNLLLVQESLMDALICINSMIYRLYTEKDYTVAEDTEKYMADLYQASEDLFIHVSKSDAILDDMDLDLLNEDEDYDEEEEGEN
jgi:hypothetical protein